MEIDSPLYEVPMHLWQSMPLGLKDQFSLFMALGKRDLFPWVSDTAAQLEPLKKQHKYKTQFMVGALYHRTPLADPRREEWMQVYKVTMGHVIFRFIGTDMGNVREVLDKDTGYMMRTPMPDTTVTTTQRNVNLMKFTRFARCAKPVGDGDMNVTSVFLPSFAGLPWELSSFPDHMPHITL
jgi:hypothetical protein